MAEAIARRLWSTPVYKFRIPPNSEETDKLKEIIIDVTGSAPSFLEPSSELTTILKEIFANQKFKTIDTVMEFGAAKLKNIPFILKQGKTVCAVEFEELSKNAITKENIKKCKKYKKKFDNLMFPNPFIGCNKKFDLTLLLNVLPVMPVFGERLYFLDLVHSKVKDDKYLLWIAQKEGSYKSIREGGKNICGDGVWIGKTKHVKTFYKYHQVPDLDELMSLYGFKLVQKWSLGSDARLYQKTKYNLFHDLIKEEKILELIPLDKTILDPVKAEPKIVEISETVLPVIPDPLELSIESLYKEKIISIPEGGDFAEEYHRVVSHALSRIFRDSFRNMDLKVEIKDGVKIIDTLFTNCATKGFFHNLTKTINCTYPIVEVKNYTDDTKNPEVDQLNGRFNMNHGNFGILVCRHIGDEDKMYERCATLIPDHIILFLTDEDIFELLNYSRENNSDEISDFMDKKLRTLLFKKG